MVRRRRQERVRGSFAPASRRPEEEAFDGRPVVGIANSWSELTPCNKHLGTIADAVRRGVLAAGGVPLEFPTMSLGEPLMRPTTMLYRNLMSMEVEETLRANPVDAVVLLGGCDKTVPAQLMGAASVDLPTIVVTGGPMMSGSFRGKPIGSGTDLWRFSEDVRAGTMTPAEYAEVESCLHRSTGHCMTMGTASTMACLSEALGKQMSGGATIQAVDSRRLQLAERSGKRAVQLAKYGPRPSEVLTRKAFENAVRVNAAIGGSTNVVLHLIAVAGRVGVDLSLNLAAVKVESQPGGRTIAALGEGSPPLPAFVGYGGVQMVDALRRGAIGVQPGCSFTELYLAVWLLWHDGHRADAYQLHTRMLPYLSYWMQDVQLIVAAEKLIAARRGLVEDEHCRAPARPLDHVERAMVDDFCAEFSAMLPVVDG